MPERPLRILELRSVRGTGGGPEKTIMTGTARTDATRYAITVCYLRDRRDTAFTLDRVARELGLDYVELLERHSFDPAVWPALRDLVRARRIDIVHAHDYKTDLLAWLLARTEGVTPMATAHGWSGTSLKERRLYYPADRLVLRAFPRVVAVSSVIAAELASAGVRRDRVVTILNGVDTTAFRRDPARVAAARARFELPVDAVVIGGVGRLSAEKRFDLLIDLLADLRRTHPAAQLLLAGAGPDASALEARATTLGVREACHFSGAYADMPTLFHALDVFVQTSDTEGTPNAVLEAMAMEVPIIATRVGGTSDLVTQGQHGLLVGRRDAPALAAAARDVLSDPGAARARALAARARAEGMLSFEARMRAVEAVYDQLHALRTRTHTLTAVA